MTGWTWAWIGLGAAVAVVETASWVATKGEQTLSSHVWRYVTRPTNRHPGLVWAARVALLAGLAVLGSHLAFGVP